MEIERKFLPDPKFDIGSLLYTKAIQIEDYYLNKYTRIRKQDDQWIKTIKGPGTIKREEYEFKLKISEDALQSIKNLVPLTKTRRVIPYQGYNFEINLFNHIKFRGNPLIIIELELKNEHEEFNKPEWLGLEVTNDERFYGYKLFERLQDSEFEVTFQV